MPDMSWMSPKRRKTTGNLRSLPNGQYVSFDQVPKISEQQAGTPSSERPTPSSRPASQPSVRSQSSTTGDGNLFYAYARRGDDIRSRFLLTFASASIANEWWLLIQAHFPDCTRPGPQLFSFKTEDLLAKAWKHSGFEHLKTKWMYISFSDTSSDGIGGATQGIIPVQDEQGNMLGGSASASDSGSASELGQARQEVKSMRNEITRLEEHFEKMMEAVERNTDSVKQLASEKSGGRKETKDGFDMKELSSHLGRMNELMENNMRHIEILAKRQSENEEKFRMALDDVQRKQGGGSLDLTQLSAHLDRIQNLMEEDVRDRRDRAQDTSRIDLSTLTEKLGNIQEAVEQNSMSVQKSLEEGAAGDDHARPERAAQRQHVGISSLEGHLAKIHSAVEQQSSHMSALMDFASGEGEVGVRSAKGSEQPLNAGLSSLGEHLEQIYNAVEEGNRHAKDTARPQSLDFSPLVTAIEHNSQQNLEVLRQLADVQNDMRLSFEKTKPLAVEFSPMAHKLDQIHAASKETLHQFKQLIDVENATHRAITSNKSAQVDLHPLAEHFQKLIDAQNATREAVERNGGELDFTPLAEHMDSVRETIEGQHNPLLEHLTGHLEAIREATDSNAEQIRSFVMEASRKQTPTSSKFTNDLDFSPLTDRLNKIHACLEETNSQSRDKSPGFGDPKFILNALSSHLSKIQAVTEQNANAVKALSTRYSSHQDKMQTTMSETSEALRRLMEKPKVPATDQGMEKRLEATNSQVRELMASHREMTKVLRELAMAITAQNKGSCDHVVIPPPRKVGRKIVGFVYDAKEGEV